MVSPLPTYRVWGEFFCKKALHGGTSVFGQIQGEMFYVVTNDQIMQGEKLMVKKFEISSQVGFILIDPGLSY